MQCQTVESAGIETLSRPSDARSLSGCAVERFTRVRLQLPRQLDAALEPAHQATKAHHARITHDHAQRRHIYISSGLSCGVQLECATFNLQVYRATSRGVREFRARCTYCACASAGFSALAAMLAASPCVWWNIERPRYAVSDYSERQHSQGESRGRG